MRSKLPVSSLLIPLCSVPVLAWDPPAADWSKSDDTDLRVMTWNIADALCRTAVKADEANSWNGVVRIVAALQPDVLLLQEAGDNSGNGTGSGVDSVAQLTATLQLFLYGGTDPVLGGSVGSYVQKFAPDYDLPYIFVSATTDAYNRNVILSRYPFASINGGPATMNDFVIGPDRYAPGGNGGIRGFMVAQIDLPDDVYAGDVVVGNCHLKSGGATSDINDRRNASQNIAYFIDHYFNGAGTGISDPNSKVIVPAIGNILDENTPFIWGGDFNQNPGSPSNRGPLEWMTQAALLGGTDGTDRDRTDSTRDSAAHPISGETSTQGSSSKLDYLCWQDSIAQARRNFVFRSLGAGVTIPMLPFPVSTFPTTPFAASSTASDHRPVLADFILPPADTHPGCSDADLVVPYGIINFFDLAEYLTLYNAGDPTADIAAPFGMLNFFDLSEYLTRYNAGCP